MNCMTVYDAICDTVGIARNSNSASGRRCTSLSESTVSACMN